MRTFTVAIMKKAHMRKEIIKYQLANPKLGS